MGRAEGKNTTGDPKSSSDARAMADRPAGLRDQGTILIAVDERPSAQDALAPGRWLASTQSTDLLLTWVHPYDRLPSLLGEGEDGLPSGPSATRR